jgi:outer membrane lipoprotein-sorting protein
VKKLITLLLCALLVPLAASAEDMTAEMLIEKALEASGGREKLQAIQSQKMTGTILVQEMEIPFTMMQQRPDRIRIESDFQGMSMVQCVADGKGWTINPMLGTSDPQDMSAFELKGMLYQADMDGLLIGYEKKGYTVEYVGEDEVEGTPVHHLKIDTHDDAIFDIYFDTEYFLPVKTTSWMKIEETEHESDMYMSDYKEVDGLMVPHAMENRMGGQTTMNLKIETVELGAEIPEDAFVRPEPAPKEPEASTDG